MPVLPTSSGGGGASGFVANFLIATDRNISRVDYRISIRISRSRGFKFSIGATRWATTSPLIWDCLRAIPSSRLK
jgi:hypothetical protein